MLHAQPPGGHRALGGGGVLSALRALAVLAALAGPAAAQDAPPAGDQTLADIRQELSVLEVEITRLRRELSTTGGADVSLPASALERLDAIEAELQDLTAQTEELTGRIDRIVTDGTNRLGDLDFRLTELEGGDIGAVAPAAPLGGEAPTAPAPAPQTGGAELAMGEQADFDAAVAAAEAGDPAEAARLFEAFVESYPGSPLAGEAQYRRGQALAEQGDVGAAARAYLAGFSGEPNGSRAPETLLALGETLRDLGQTQEACVTFAEVRVRFVDTEAAAAASEASTALACP